jgi:TonB-dependent SusC/RagA subfamily outer membrane receptor
MRSRSTLPALTIIATLGLVGCHLDPEEGAPEPAPATSEAPRGANGVLDQEDLENNRVTRIEQLLEARVSGVRVRRLANGEFSVQIRGTNTLQGSTEPLFVLDGVPLLNTRSLMGINPSDVARIEVLKDGTAAAYGTRGANGVILITTRKQ